MPNTVITTSITLASTSLHDLFHSPDKSKSTFKICSTLPSSSHPITRSASTNTCRRKDAHKNWSHLWMDATANMLPFHQCVKSNLAFQLNAMRLPGKFQMIKKITMSNSSKTLIPNWMRSSLNTNGWLSKSQVKNH